MARGSAGHEYVRAVGMPQTLGCQAGWRVRSRCRDATDDRGSSGTPGTLRAYGPHTSVSSARVCDLAARDRRCPLSVLANGGWPNAGHFRRLIGDPRRTVWPEQRQPASRRSSPHREGAVTGESCDLTCNCAFSMNQHPCGRRSGVFRAGGPHAIGVQAGRGNVCRPRAKDDRLPGGRRERLAPTGQRRSGVRRAAGTFGAHGMPQTIASRASIHGTHRLAQADNTFSVCEQEKHGFEH